MPHDDRFDDAPPTLYTLGYAGGWDYPALLAAIDATDGVLVDIRYHPASRDVRWRPERLRREFGDRYLLLSVLGNVNYKTGGPVRIHNARAGIDRLRVLLAAERPPLLMCACKSWRECHRLVVARLAADEIALPIVHLEPGRFRPPAAGTLFAAADA